MPKGDPKRIQRAIDEEGRGYARQNLENTRTRTEDLYGRTYNAYLVDRDRQSADYDNIMGSYGDFLGSLGPRFDPMMAGYSNLAAGGNDYGMDPQFRGSITDAISGYGDFAKTGGFSPEDISAMRARAIAPTRAIYANANADIDRQRRVQGGYSPNYTAAKAKLARNLSQEIGDRNIDAEASLAQLRQQGRLAGLGGLTSAGGTGQSLQNALNSLNAQQRLGGLAGMTDVGRAVMSGQLGGMQGMGQLYGTTPGREQLSQQGMINVNGQMIDVQKLTNDLAQMIIQGQLGRGQMPTRWDAYKSAGQGTAGFMSAAGGMAGMSSIELKKNLRELSDEEILDKLSHLKLYTWVYKNDADEIRHVGPIAEDMKEIFGVGDGKSIALVDVMGIVMMTMKALAKRK